MADETIEDRLARQRGQLGQGRDRDMPVEDRSIDYSQTIGGSGVESQWYDPFVGLAEGAGTVASGMMGMIPMALGGITAGSHGIVNALKGKENPFGESREIVDYFGDMVPQYAPQTQYGKDVTENIAYPFQKLEEGLTAAGDWVQDRDARQRQGSAEWMAENFGGDPLDHYERPSSVFPAALSIAPDLAALATPARGVPQALRETMQVRSDLKDAGGFTPQESYFPATDRLREYGLRHNADKPLGSGMDEVGQKVVELDRAGRDRIGALYDEAEAAGATISTDHFAPLSREINRINRQYATVDDPVVKRMVGELNSLSQKVMQERSSFGGTRLGADNVGTNSIREIMEIRQRISNSLPSDFQSPQYALLAEMRDSLDNFIDNGITSEMITGDPSAFTKWDNARSEWKKHRTLFDTTNALTKLRRAGVVDEADINAVLFGANATNTVRKGESTVRALGEILGKDSPEFKSMQESVLSDILKPLVGREVDPEMLVHNVERFHRRNSAMGNELFGQEMMDQLETLSDYAYALAKETPRDQVNNINMTRTIASRFGSSLSKQAQEQNLIMRFLQEANRRLLPQSGPRANRITSSMTGTPRSDIFPKSSVGLPATLEGMRSAQLDDEEMTRMNMPDRVNRLLGRQ